MIRRLTINDTIDFDIPHVLVRGEEGRLRYDLQTPYQQSLVRMFPYTVGTWSPIKNSRSLPVIREMFGEGSRRVLPESNVLDERVIVFDSKAEWVYHFSVRFRTEDAMALAFLACVG